MVKLFKKVKDAIAGKGSVEFEPTSPLDRLAKEGIRPLIMTEQLENRIALLVGVRETVTTIFDPTKTLKEKMEALDRGLERCMIVSQAWGRGMQVWHTFSAQFRELRTMPAYWDSLVEEFMDMVNKGWLPQDVLTPTPIVLIVPSGKGQGIDLGEFETSTRTRKE